MNNNEILNDISNVLKYEDDNDLNKISVSSIIKSIRSYNLEYQDLSLKERYSFYFEKMMTEHYKRTKVNVLNFNLEDNSLEILFDIDYNNCSKLKPIIFSKINDDLIVKKDETGHGSKILSFFGTEINQLFDDLFSIHKKINEKKEGIQTINSNFVINVDYNSVKIYYKNIEDLIISAEANESDLDIVTSSHNLLNVVKENELEITSQLFVEISDCPKWLQSYLFEIRKSK